MLGCFGSCSPSEPASTSGSISWSPTLATSFASPTDAPDPSPPHLHSHSHTAQQPQPQQPQQPQQQPQPGPSGQQLQFTFQTAVSVPVQVPSQNTIALTVTPSALRDAFITHAIDLPTLSSLIQSYVLAHPSATPLTSVIHALFDASILASSASVASTSASTSASGSTSASMPSAGHARTDVFFTLLRRFVDACAFFPNTLVHANVSGPMAGPRALQTALRKSSVWAPINESGSSGTGTTAHGSLSDEMERIKADRQRRKDHVQWAQIHAAAIELGIVGGANGATSSSTSVNVPVGVGVVGTSGNTAYHHHPAQGQELRYGVPSPSSSSTDTFSEMMVRDAVWESDEVEWVAGIIVLRAIIRTGGMNRKTEWEQLLGAYERRWKEIKDEARQALVTVGLFCFALRL